MAKIKLAEALLRRKELQEHVDRLSAINREGLFDVKVTRKSAHEGVDDVIAQVPKVSMEQVTHCYNTHARALREVDAVIQQANWETEVEVPDTVMEQYTDPYVERTRATS
ncbi:MAG: hypothetical protein GTN99_02815 [Candidatus Dadabacteria bacterium]|nr:hypothetical protein [Candidatus Dadabacteria bacterium]